MNKNLADKIVESLEKRILSKTLLLICIAKLWERTTYTKQDNAERRRKLYYIVNFVVEKQYISKDEITNILPTISMECCPSYDRIDRVVEIIGSGEYSYDDSFIPERWIKYKSAEQLEKDRRRKRLTDYQAESKQKNKPEKQVEDISADELQAREDLYRYVEERILNYDKGIVLNSAQIISINNLLHGPNGLRQNQEVKYTYTLIFETFKYCTTEIEKQFIGKRFKNENHKLNYACSIVGNYINTVYNEMKKAKEAEEIISRRIPEHKDFEELQAEQRERFKAAQKAAARKRPRKTNKKLEELW